MEICDQQIAPDCTQPDLSTADDTQCATCDGEIGACKGCQEALPKLTNEELERRGIQWPEWGKYAAVDADGSASFYGGLPFVHGDIWRCRAGDWSRIKNKSVGDYSWDASDWQHSLIERPTEHKLPDWCKVGNWVWISKDANMGYNEYHKIEKIEDDETIKFSGGLCTNTCNYEKLFHEARLHPWTFEEAQQYLFCPIRFKATGAILGMIGLDPVNGALFPACGDHNNVYFASLDELSQRGELLDGSPCGVLEHKNEDGEWVR